MRSVLKMGRKLLIVASKRYGDYVVSAEQTENT